MAGIRSRKIVKGCQRTAMVIDAYTGSPLIVRSSRPSDNSQDQGNNGQYDQYMDQTAYTVYKYTQ
jgi:hypothetical protein